MCRYIQCNETNFDLVMAIDVMEHVEDNYKFLRNLREKGDYKILHIPLALSVQSILRMSPILYAWKKVGHIHNFTKETALAILQDCGYSIKDYFYTAGSIELPAARNFNSYLMRLPRKIAFKLHPDLAVRILGGYSLMVLAR